MCFLISKIFLFVPLSLCLVQIVYIYIRSVFIQSFLAFFTLLGVAIMKLFHKKYIWVVTYDSLRERCQITIFLINWIHLTSKKKSRTNCVFKLSCFYLIHDKIRNLKQVWLQPNFPKQFFLKIRHGNREHMSYMCSTRHQVNQVFILSRIAMNQMEILIFPTLITLHWFPSHITQHWYILAFLWSRYTYTNKKFRSEFSFNLTSFSAHPKTLVFPQ